MIDEFRNRAQLEASCLDTNGPFVMLNSLRQLNPRSSHTVLVSFTPHKEQVVRTFLDILSLSPTLLSLSLMPSLSSHTVLVSFTPHKEQVVRTFLGILSLSPTLLSLSVFSISDSLSLSLLSLSALSLFLTLFLSFKLIQ